MKITLDLSRIPKEQNDKIIFLNFLEKSSQGIIGLLDANYGKNYSNKTLLEWGWGVINKEEINFPLYRKHEEFLLKIKPEELQESQYYIHQELVEQAHIHALGQKNNISLRIEAINSIYTFIKDLEKTKKIKSKGKSKKETPITEEVEPIYYILSKIQGDEFDLIFDSEHTIWDDAHVFTQFKKTLPESRKLVGKLIRDYGIEVTVKIIQELKTKKPEEVLNVVSFCIIQGKKYQLERIKQLGAKEKRSQLVL